MPPLFPAWACKSSVVFTLYATHSGWNVFTTFVILLYCHQCRPARVRPTNLLT
ncbi:hypothetical protein BDA96_05G228200 [Sorghum bicolor]|uniref:Uncharacterized protein n=1 Tax=Sorghum bicolor TaxID=4558 RepID=A0A921R0A7_SORBI|nr:hypothetical protein BDA96_05G228200 [Sorghum bicolor]